MRSYKIVIHASTKTDAELALEQIRQAVSVGCTGISWMESGKDGRGGYSLGTDDVLQGGTLLFREPGLLNEESEDRLRKLCHDGGIEAVSRYLQDAGTEFTIEMSIDGDVILGLPSFA